MAKEPSLKEELCDATLDVVNCVQSWFPEENNIRVSGELAMDKDALAITLKYITRAGDEHTLPIKRYDTFYLPLSDPSSNDDQWLRNKMNPDTTYYRPDHSKQFYMVHDGQLNKEGKPMFRRVSFEDVNTLDRNFHNLKSESNEKIEAECQKFGNVLSTLFLDRFTCHVLDNNIKLTRTRDTRVFCYSCNNPSVEPLFVQLSKAYNPIQNIHTEHTPSPPPKRPNTDPPLPIKKRIADEFRDRTVPPTPPTVLGEPSSSNTPVNRSLFG